MRTQIMTTDNRIRLADVVQLICFDDFGVPQLVAGSAGPGALYISRAGDKDFDAVCRRLGMTPPQVTSLTSPESSRKG
jgi:hypothetical protein